MRSQQSFDTEDTATFSTGEETREADSVGRDHPQLTDGLRLLAVKNPAVANFLLQNTEDLSDDTMKSLATKPELLTKILDQVEGEAKYTDKASKEESTADRVVKLLKNETDEDMGGGNYYTRKEERERNAIEERDQPEDTSFVSENGSQLSETVKAVQALRKAVASRQASFSVGSLSGLVSESDTMSHNDHNVPSGWSPVAQRTRNGIPPLPKMKNGGIISRLLKKAKAPVKKMAKFQRAPFARHDKNRIPPTPSSLLGWSDSSVENRHGSEPEDSDSIFRIEEKNSESLTLLSWDERFQALSQQIDSTASELEPASQSKTTTSLETREEDGETTLESRQDSSTARETESNEVTEKSKSTRRSNDTTEDSRVSILFSVYSSGTDSDEDTNSASVALTSIGDITAVVDTKSDGDNNSEWGSETDDSDEYDSRGLSDEASSNDELVFSYSDASSEGVLQTESVVSAQFSREPYSITEPFFGPTQSEVEEIKEGGSAFYSWIWGRSGPLCG